MGLKGTRVEGRRPIRRVSTVLPPGGYRNRNGEEEEVKSIALSD